MGRLSAASVREGKMEELVAHYKETVAPTYKESEGFLGAYLLLDRTKGEAQSLTLWRNVQDLENNNNNNPKYRQAMATFAPLFAESPRTSLFEIAVVVEKKGQDE